jgi:hypothetical protein
VDGALVVLAVVPAWLIAGGLLVERHLAERAHRRERERLVRATLARHVPEFAALERIVAEDVAPTRRPVPVEDDWPKGAPRQPEGLAG